MDYTYNTFSVIKVVLHSSIACVILLILHLNVEDMLKVFELMSYLFFVTKLIVKRIFLCGLLPIRNAVVG